jgi:hypothetical protein
MKITARLKIVFFTILILMLSVSVWATLRESIMIGGNHLFREPWGVATLADAYCGFTTFFVWVVYKESKMLYRLVWLVLILVLGNIAMSIYVLLQIYSLPAGASVSDILLRNDSLVKS